MPNTGFTFTGLIAHLNKFKFYTPGLTGPHHYEHLLKFPKNGARQALKRVNRNPLVKKAKKALLNKMVHSIGKKYPSGILNNVIEYIVK